ncbi:hypothetical protein [Nonomuraea helvata]|uniref:hypothetical protein n=1 Tax=Nonomuraea helvata TaxID=37484 RepID=UPI0031E5C8BD
MSASALLSQGLSLTWVPADERTVRRMKARPAASHSSYDVGVQAQVWLLTLMEAALATDEDHLILV